MKRLLLAVPLLLSACAPQIVKHDLAGPAGTAVVPVRDLRPANEKKEEIFSLMITSSGYGIYRKGDASLDPTMQAAFGHKAMQKLGAPAMKDATIHHMVVYMNLQSELRRGAVGAGFGGMIGSLIATAGMTGANLSQGLADRAKFEGVKDEYERAFYTEAENPKKGSVFVVYIDAEIAGRRTFTRTMAATVGPEGSVPYVLAVDSAIAYWLQQHEAAAPAAAPATDPASTPPAQTPPPPPTT